MSDAWGTRTAEVVPSGIVSPTTRVGIRVGSYVIWAGEAKHALALVEELARRWNVIAADRGDMSWP